MTAVRAPAPASQPATAVVEELARLFARLHAEDVRYCHWKSNEHLGASLAGVTDLDLLVDRRAVQPFAWILAETGFKRIQTIARVGYPGIESHLGLDRARGRLLHVHVHYQLTLGEKHLKGYRLPWENTLLDGRTRDPATGVYVADPHAELLLLLVRATLKIRTRDALWAAAGRPYVRGNLLREFTWLRQRVDADRLQALACELVGERAAAALPDLLGTAAPRLRALRAFRGLLRPTIAEHRLYTPLAARGRRWQRELASLWSRLVGQSLAPSRRVFPQGGLLVALVGVDGSGKSTLAAALTTWLTSLVDVLPVYLGSGKGPTSLPRIILEAAAALVRGAGLGGAGAQASASPHPRRGRGSVLRTAGEVLWLLALARERRHRVRRAWRARNLGIVVICDRFLQTQVADFNDGPAFSHWLAHPSRWLRAAARAELAALRMSELQPPDLVIRLHVTPEIAARRRPGMGLERLRHGGATIAGLRYPPATRVADISSDEPFERVLLRAKHAIWECL